jgi:hypothetical protein|tara:strand:+ start:217 stop:420 length:204 start_codon:yes stop_codon:yes gene_type:complete
MPDEDWDKYKNLVLHELERTNTRLNHIDKKLTTIEEKLTIINAKIYAAAFIASVVITGTMQYIFALT